MKNLRKLIGIIFVAAIIMCVMAACDDLFGSLNKNDPDTYKPVVFTSYGTDSTKYELTITKTSRDAVSFTPGIGDSYTLTIRTTAGAAKTSTGQITDISGNTFTLMHTGTSEKFRVTVSANSPSGGTIISFTGDIPINNSATKSPAPGELTPNQTPVAGDYDIGNLTQSVGNITAVTITPKGFKSTGAITIYYAGAASTTYAKSKTLPTAAGTYAVTFDVAAASGWNAATGLSAGNLEINTNKTPAAGDYDISNLTQSVGSVKAVTIAAKAGKSPGAVSNIKYAGNAALPTAAGTYAVTFDVAAATGWKAAAGLSAGNLVISATQAQTLSVTILGDPKVGTELRADVQKNFSGKVEYQWRSNGVAINDWFDEGWISYVPSPADSDKAISVKVRYGELSAESPAVTIQPVTTYTVKIEQWSYMLYVNVVVGGWNWGIYEENGFSCQWQRNGVDIHGATNPDYNLTADDVGKKIRAEVKGFGKTVYSDEIEIPSDFDVAYTVTIQRYDDMLIARAIGDTNGNHWSIVPGAGTSFSCQWQRDEVNISGATNPNYYLTAEDAGKKIRAEVKGFGKTVYSDEIEIP